MNSLADGITLAVFLGVPALGIWLYFRMFNNPDGERYLKMRNQGPFVPTPEENTLKDAVESPPERHS
jgi:hypothetical protein